MNYEFEVLTDTISHISEVAENLIRMAEDLKARGVAHDRSKFEAIEFDAFVQTRPKFKVANYGTPEYQECVDIIKPSIDHHYKVNRHHTGFFSDGFQSMNLLDILEMLADWRAASRRSPDLTFKDSLPRAYAKYGIPENMQRHIEETLKFLGWL